VQRVQPPRQLGEIRWPARPAGATGGWRPASDVPQPHGPRPSAARAARGDQPGTRARRRRRGPGDEQADAEGPAPPADPARPRRAPPRRAGSRDGIAAPAIAPRPRAEDSGRVDHGPTGVSSRPVVVHWRRRAGAAGRGEIKVPPRSRRWQERLAPAGGRTARSDRVEIGDDFGPRPPGAVEAGREPGQPVARNTRRNGQRGTVSCEDVAQQPRLAAPSLGAAHGLVALGGQLGPRTATNSPAPPTTPGNCASARVKNNSVTGRARCAMRHGPCGRSGHRARRSRLKEVAASRASSTQRAASAAQRPRAVERVGVRPGSGHDRRRSASPDVAGNQPSGCRSSISPARRRRAGPPHAYGAHRAARRRDRLSIRCWPWASSANRCVRNARRE